MVYIIKICTIITSEVIIMSKKKKEIPVPEPRPDEDGYEFPSVSSGDMTGLIPTPANDIAKRDSYGEILPFQAEKP